MCEWAIRHHFKIDSLRSLKGFEHVSIDPSPSLSHELKTYRQRGQSGSTHVWDDPDLDSTPHWFHLTYYDTFMVDDQEFKAFTGPHWKSGKVHSDGQSHHYRILSQRAYSVDSKFSRFAYSF